MRTAVLVAVAALALTITGASQPASTVTKTVSITATAFSPNSRTIATTDAIKWTNNDTKNTAGTFRYHDALYPSHTGKIVVNGPPPAITIGASVPILDYGQSTHISGVVSSHKAGETVTVYAQPYGQASPTLIATLLSGTSGVWDVVVKPTLLTTYQAHWKSTVSQQIGVQLRPAVTFSAAKRWGSVKIKADRSLAGKKAYLQKFTRFHQWVKVRSVVLGPTSSKRFLLELPAGHRYAVRIFMSLNQIGAGYLDGFSSTVVAKVPR